MPSFQPQNSADQAADHGDFNRVAWFYDALARVVFGNAQRRAQEAALEHLPPGAPHVLVLGGGSGWVLGQVLRRRPAATVLYLEASLAMLTRAQALLQREFPHQQAQVEFCHGTERALPSEGLFDAVVTFFVLDCLTPPAFATALPRLHAALRPGGCWLLADFSPPHKWWQHRLLQAMYLFFQVTARLKAKALPPYEQALAELGLHPVYQARFYSGFLLALSLQKPAGTETTAVETSRF
ncbi:hypothetical protein GCM10023185_43320 [Hymenobacter saemangeumensis]|uniref:Methyltransferase domain-containing protein n=1 Tax=Hymenobacter saemangeumensis TaxID=1084522 RepID=A0ABP8ISE3_9BACT